MLWFPHHYLLNKAESTTAHISSPLKDDALPPVKLYHLNTKPWGFYPSAVEIQVSPGLCAFRHSKPKFALLIIHQPKHGQLYTSLILTFVFVWFTDWNVRNTCWSHIFICHSFTPYLLDYST